MTESRTASMGKNKSEYKNQVSEFQKALKDELTAIAQNIHKEFENAWKNKKELHAYAIYFYHGTHNDYSSKSGIDLCLEEIVAKFNEYKDITQIKVDFISLRSKWGQAYANEVDKAFFEGYQILLYLMEAHFIETYIRSLSEPMPEQRINSPGPELHLDSIAVKCVRNQLQKSFFKQPGDSFKSAAGTEIKALNEKIDLYNKKYAKFVEDQAKFIEHKQADKMEDLAFHEKYLVNQITLLEALQQEREDLAGLRENLYVKNIKAVNQTIDQLAAEAQMPETGIDINTLEEFKQKREHLKYLKDAIENARRAFYRTPEQLAAKERLNEIRAFFIKEMRKYDDDHGSFFGVNPTYKALRDGYQLLRKSNVVSPSEDFQKKAKAKFENLSEKYKKRQQEMKDLQLELQNKAKQELDSDSTKKLSKQILSDLRDDLMRFVMNINEIVMFSAEWLDDYRTKLDTVRKRIVAEQAAAQLAKAQEALQTIKNPEKITISSQPKVSNNEVKEVPEELAVLPVTQQSLANESMLNRVWQGICSFFSTIKSFLSRCYGYLCCCCIADDNADNAIPEAETRSPSPLIIKSTTAMIPFAKASSQHVEESAKKQIHGSLMTKTHTEPKIDLHSDVRKLRLC